MIGGGGDSFGLEKERSMLQKNETVQIQQLYWSFSEFWVVVTCVPVVMTGSLSCVVFENNSTRLLSQKIINNCRLCLPGHKGPSFKKKNLTYKADHSHNMWTAGKALYLQKVPWNLSDVEIKNSYDLMDGKIAQCFGLSFQRQIQGNMTLFFELSISVILFSALIFFIKILPLLWRTR